MPIAPKILQFVDMAISYFGRTSPYVFAVRCTRERVTFGHALVVFKKHVSLFLELGTALRMGVAIGSREGCVEVPGSMVEINDLFSVR